MMHRVAILLLLLLPCHFAQQRDTRPDCDSLIQAAAGCRNYELLAACALSCAHWLSSADSLSLNPDAQPHGPLRAPPGSALFERLIELTTVGKADVNENCASWARRGECDKNRAFMNENCVKSCTQRTAIAVAMTAPDAVVDLHDECADWAISGECSHNPISMLTWCPATCLHVAESTVHSREEL